MKYIPIIIFFAFSFLGSVEHQSKQKIQYIIGDEIKEEIKKNITELKSQHEKEGTKLSNEDFYVRIGYWEVGKLFLHIDTYTKRSIDRKNINRTNRYIRINKNLQLPVLFDYDKMLSSAYHTKNGAYIMATNHGGRWLFMSSHGDRLIPDKE